MLIARELNIKPACMNEIHALPAKMMPMVVEKITWLTGDPIPDGKLKKKLRHPPGTYRLRIGDYRLIYAFGDAWVRLLAIRRRDDAYAGKDLVEYEEPEAWPPGEEPGGLPDDFPEESGEPLQGPPPKGQLPPATSLEPGVGLDPGVLPRSITVEWLAELKVPEECHAALRACADEDALLAVPVPPWVLERVVDNLWPRPLDEVARQPDCAVEDPQDLQRYKDGDLLGFLLRLDSGQEKLVDWRLRGPSIIKGGPGTGKSTVALHRVRALLDRAVAEGRPAPRILFTTYTNALTRFSEQLLQQLLGERASLVTVSTADNIARKMVEQVETVADPAMPLQLVRALDELRARWGKRRRTGGKAGNAGDDAALATLADLRTDFLLEEFEWIIEGRGLGTLEEYLAADRTGRAVPLHRSLRVVVWDLYQEFQAELVRQHLTTFGRVRIRALEILRAERYQERYDAVLIDEAQDLKPAALSLLVELCRDPSGVYLTADAGQTIYSRGFTWSQTNERLRFRGRTALLKRNYRSSGEIAQAATAFARMTGAGDPDCLDLECVHRGPPPVLHACDTPEQQWSVAADFINHAAGELRLQPQAAAVLVPSNALGEQAADELTRLGLPARFMRGTKLDLYAPEVKVLTLHSAKGLEFPIVVIVGLQQGHFPRLPRELTPEEAEEETQAFRRLLFVGITRAMRGLLICYPRAKPSPFIAELDPALWRSGWQGGR